MHSKPFRCFDCDARTFTYSVHDPIKFGCSLASGRPSQNPTLSASRYDRLNDD